MRIEIRLLGALEAYIDGVAVDLGPPQQRALLALLALRIGTVVPIATIVDSLWPEQPPSSASKVVQTYVSRFRRLFGDAAIVRRGRGYQLSAEVAVDAREFERLLESGRPAEALALWRGSALADLELLESDAARLDELRLQTIETSAEREVQAGAAERVIPELLRLVGDYPLRERLIALLMRALYLSGRQAEALETYRVARARLVAELGLEPGADLRELERRILAQDPTLRPETYPQQQPADSSRPAKTSRPRRTSRRRLLGAAAVAVATSAATAGVLATRGGGHAVVIRPNSIIRIDASTDKVVDSIPVGRAPSGILVTGDDAWVANEGDRTLTRVDLHTHQEHTIGGVSGVGFLARDRKGMVYASGWDFPYVWRIDPETNEVAGRYRVRTRAVGLAVGGGFLFVVDRLANGVTSIDLAHPATHHFIPVGADPIVAAFGGGALWVANSDAATVSVIRPGLSKPQTISVDLKPFGIAAGAGAIWVASNTDSTVTRIDPETGRIVKRLTILQNGLNSDLYSVATGAGSVWAIGADSQSITRIDPHTNTVIATIHVYGAQPEMLAANGNAIWVTLAPPGT